MTNTFLFKKEKKQIDKKTLHDPLHTFYHCTGSYVLLDLNTRKKKSSISSKKKKKKLQIDNLQQTKDISAARFGTSDD